MTIPEVVTPEVQAAIAEIAAVHPKLSADPDSEGGAYVVVQDVELGPAYKQCKTWVGFHIAYSYPQADVYPHFVRSDLSRMDGAALGEGIQSPIEFHRRAATQLSRRSNHLNPAVQTALLKLQKVLQWLNAL